MAKDQQANQNQLMGANASQQTPSYSPQMGANAQMGAQANQNQLSQMGAQANQNQLSQMGAAAQMAMNARPQMGAQANFSAMNARPQMGMNANARSIWGSPPPPKRPASSYPNFQNALRKYFQQNPGSYQQQRGQGGSPLDSAQLQGPSSFASGSPYSNQNAQMANMNAAMAGSRPQQFGLTRQAGMAPTGGPTNARSIWGSPPRQPSSKNWASAIRAGGNRQYGSSDMAQLQGPSSFAANSPYSNRNR